eukprot:gi/632978747/ref/XP_007906089.1/ PREDICTED: Wilms tumor protein 1-interacting protein [Callorhinchus milii]
MAEVPEELGVQASRFLQDLSLYEAARDGLGLYGGRRELSNPCADHTKPNLYLQMAGHPPGGEEQRESRRLNGGGSGLYHYHLHGGGGGGEALCKLCPSPVAPRGVNGGRGGLEPLHQAEGDGGCFRSHGFPPGYTTDCRRYSTGTGSSSGSGGSSGYEGLSCSRLNAYPLYPGGSGSGSRGNNVSASRSSAAAAAAERNNVTSGRGGTVAEPRGNGVSGGGGGGARNSNVGNRSSGACEPPPPEPRLSAASPRSSLASSSSSSQDHSKHSSPRSSLHGGGYDKYPSPRASLVVVAGGGGGERYPSPRASLSQYESPRSSYASTASDTSKHSSPRASLNSSESRPSSNRTSGISMGYDQRHISPRSSYSDCRSGQLTSPEAEGPGGQGPAVLSPRSSISSHSSRGSMSAAYPDLQLPSPRASVLSSGHPEEGYVALDPPSPADPYHPRLHAQASPRHDQPPGGPSADPTPITVLSYNISPTKGPSAAHKFKLPYQVTPSRESGPSQAERRLEALTKELERELELHMKKEYLGICVKCGKGVYGVSQACQAMGNLYHTNCFICCSCGRRLRGKAFYNVNGKVYCEEDFLYSGFQQTADKCFVCGHLIMEMILQALGKSYHPGCFRCVVCNECLDGVPFTVDVENNIYCVKDYHTVFAPKCASCGNPILPAQGSEETIRVVSMDKDYHVECYHCEDCRLQLNDEEGHRCYPLHGHLLCHGCHIRRLSLPSPPPPGYQLHVTEL